MINIIKKYYRYLFVFIGMTFLFVFAYVYSVSNVDTPRSEKLSNVKEKATKTVFVDVKGAVNKPGVYELDENKRVIDAISLAGGLNDKADTINLNLSKKVSDEMIIIVYTKTEIENYTKKNDNRKAVCASLECNCIDDFNDACNNSKTNDSKSTSKTTVKTSSKVSINSADKNELMTLSGIGESKANSIISYRQENGSFKTIDDIKNVSGIGDSVFEKIKNNITL